MGHQSSLSRGALAVIVALFAAGFGASGDAGAQRIVTPRPTPVLPPVTPLPSIVMPTLPDLDTAPILVVPPAPRIAPVPNVLACCICAHDRNCRPSCCTGR